MSNTLVAELDSLVKQEPEASISGWDDDYVGEAGMY